MVRTFAGRNLKAADESAQIEVVSHLTKRSDHIHALRNHPGHQPDALSVAHPLTKHEQIGGKVARAALTEREARDRVLLSVGDECRHLADEIFKVPEGLEPLGDYVIVYSDVLVN